MPRPIPSAGCGTWLLRPPDRTKTWRPRSNRRRPRSGPAPGRHTERALAAALAHLHAGAFDIALGLLARAEAHAVDDLQRARVEQLRGQVEWASVTGREAPVLLLQAAKRLETLDA